MTQVLDFAWVQWQLLCAASARRRARVILRLWCNESHRQHQGKALLGAWRVVVSLGTWHWASGWSWSIPINQEGRNPGLLKTADECLVWPALVKSSEEIAGRWNCETKFCLSTSRVLNVWYTSKVTFPLAIPLPRLACRAPLTAPVQKQREFRVGLVAVFSTPGGSWSGQQQVTGSVITTYHDRTSRSERSIIHDTTWRCMLYSLF